MTVSNNLCKWRTRACSRDETWKKGNVCNIDATHQRLKQYDNSARQLRKFWKAWNLYRVFRSHQEEVYWQLAWIQIRFAEVTCVHSGSSYYQNIAVFYFTLMNVKQKTIVTVGENCHSLKLLFLWEGVSSNL